MTEIRDSFDFTQDRFQSDVRDRKGTTNSND
jgi:hypothetical protein